MGLIWFEMAIVFLAHHMAFDTEQFQNQMQIFDPKCTYS